MPVTLLENTAHGVRVISCPVAASDTLKDLQSSVSSLLGSHDVITALLYRGSQPLLSSPLPGFTGTSTAPRFQVCYTQAHLSPSVLT